MLTSPATVPGRLAAALLLALLLGVPSARADVPSIAHPVTDLAGVIAPADERAVEDALVELREATGVQMAVLVVDTTAGAPIDDYAQEVFDAWGGGSAERDDGVLFVLAIGDRRNRLHLGYGLEPLISDGDAVGMLGDLRDALRAGDYAGATLQLVAAVRSRVDHLAPGGPITAPSVPLTLHVGALLVLIPLALGAGFAWQVLRRARRRLTALVVWVGGALVVLVLATVDGGLWSGIVYGVLWLPFAGAGVLGGDVLRKGRVRFTVLAVIVFGALGLLWMGFHDSVVINVAVVLVVALAGVCFLLVVEAFFLADGGGGGRSWSSSGSSSWSSSSSSSRSSSWSSYSSSSSWSGGGGSSGGGGASSSW